MHARLIATLLLLIAGTWAASCSSGLGHDPRKKNTPPAAAAASQNLPVGFDLGFVPTDPVAEPAVAGLVIPAIGTTAAREVVLLAFSTAAASNAGDGASALLARDATTDSNGAADVFVAAISAQSIERRAFAQSLAGKFRHPRCVTCHSMSAPDTTAFVSSTQPHAGPPPGVGFPFRQPEVCAPCHVTSNTFPVPGWQSPDSSIFDIRPKTVAQIAMMAQNIPADDTEHFVNDKRVLWALDSGILPAVGGRNGVADDNQDGVPEPEDNDGIARTVPGGSVAFLREIEDWRASGMVVGNAGAVRDVTLVSRQAGTSNAGNGASTAPQVKWVPNSAFDPNNAAATNPIGTLFVAFQSTASNLTAGDGNGAMDVFRAAVELRAEEDATGTPTVGGLNLVTLNGTILCSATNGTTTAGNGASGRPAIGGDDAQWIAFESLATDLVASFGDNNGGTAKDVFLRNVGAAGSGTSTQLVSGMVGGATAGGNGASERPALAADGSAIAFESDADDLINGDGNGVRDVFFATTTGGAPFVKMRASVTGAGLEGSGGASRNASVHSSGGRVRVAFESDKTDLATVGAVTNAFLFDSNTGTTNLLNRRESPGVSTVGNGSARAPVFFPDGSAIAFESDARNLDVLRADDNRFSDVFVVETQQLDGGRVLPFRISVTATEAASSNGASMRPVVGSFNGSAAFPTGFAAYVTAATNLGTSDTSNVMVSFLGESSGILVDFTAVPASGLAPLQVQFTDASTGSPNGWQWDFDNDGNVDSTLQNPSHTYPTPGDFAVKLAVRNKNTEADKTEAAFVHVVGPVTADFTATPTTTGGTPLTVLFKDASTQPNGTISGWAWDFDGDGIVDSTLQNPSHTYNTPGTFAVTLTSTGEHTGGSVTKAGFVTVTAPGALVASFTSTLSSSPVPSRVAGTAVGSVYDDETVQFTGMPNGAASYFWNFGDGTTSTAQSPTHVFATPGTYDVFLTVTDVNGMDSEVKPALITSIGGQTVATIPASKDTTIYSPVSLANTCNPANVDIAAGRPFNGSDQGVRRALLEFDVAGTLPTGSVIVAASLDLTCTRAPSATPPLQAFTLHRVTQEWGEVGTNPGGSIGGGGVGQTPPAAVTGDATWNSPTHPSPAWAGGTFDAAASSTASVGATGPYNWPTSTKMVTDVQGWMTSANNHGWILLGIENLTMTATARGFGSRSNGTDTARPSLTVTFRPPLP